MHIRAAGFLKVDEHDMFGIQLFKGLLLTTYKQNEVINTKFSALPFTFQGQNPYSNAFS